MNEFLGRVYFNNSVQDYLIALGIVFLGISIIAAFRRLGLKKLRQWTSGTDTNADDFIVESFARFGIPILYISVFYFALYYLKLSAKANIFLDKATMVAVTFLLIRFISSFISRIVRNYLRRKHDSEVINEMGAIQLIITFVIWFIGLGFLFNNLGYDLTAIIAGLGVGGIAVALAAQNILGDLFNYFVIFLDKPFEVGDYLAVGSDSGTVEHIGVKTTRLRALSGEQLVFANSDLTSSRIHNYKRMEQRRIAFKIGVTYQTSAELVEKIPQILKDIVQSQEPVRFDRAHFASYGDSSLNYEIVYTVLDSDYTKYMDIQQAINVAIYRQFAALGIDLAFPTRTLFIVNQQDEKEKLEANHTPA